ncbi:MAG: OB-fold domain-containing protein [Dehalococcoidia bacterium]|nr:OB-fold domain-containing protein [Dehalococcoidia bacterium]
MTDAAETANVHSKKRVPIKEGFLTTPLSDLREAKLQGSRCASCGEVFLGIQHGCQSCGATGMETVVLSNRGKLYSYTVLRNRPPGNYMGPDPFVPFAVGLIELPEGIRVISPLTHCNLDSLHVNMDVELALDRLYEDEEGSEVIAFSFRPE